MVVLMTLGHTGNEHYVLNISITGHRCLSCLCQSCRMFAVRSKMQKQRLNSFLVYFRDNGCRRLTVIQKLIDTLPKNWSGTCKLTGQGLELWSKWEQVQKENKKKTKGGEGDSRGQWRLNTIGLGTKMMGKEKKPMTKWKLNYGKQIN